MVIGREERERERERDGRKTGERRERERERDIYIYIHIHIHTDEGRSKGGRGREIEREREIYIYIYMHAVGGESGPILALQKGHLVPETCPDSPLCGFALCFVGVSGLENGYPVVAADASLGSLIREVEFEEKNIRLALPPNPFKT